ncbi:hypothetical protein [Chryseobacterium caseinilyticum]|uniref:Uncharacterized protein n=1 Tax=Chryseobacterium caseinilyticum TaxID=2771428 RepID=A0ABR8Z764_9FLAO|nr:hypothetical protein [Chryseobacterium caseinilyticum]MBD8081143.1 hypothetical protein [Chryseobacterium caseinilyticum]
MEKLNMELRNEILEISLWVEASVNKLITVNLSVENAVKSKSFNNSRGIPFGSKIDLLYDIETINKEEHIALELIAFIRNKFMHLVIYNTLTELFDASDNSWRKKLEKFAHEDKFETEEDYLNAFRKLQINVLNFLNEKFNKRKLENDKISELLLNHHEEYIDLQKKVKEFITEMFVLLTGELDKDNVTLEFQKILTQKLMLFAENTPAVNNLEVFKDKELLRRIFK